MPRYVLLLRVSLSQDCHFRLPLDALAAETLISYQIQNVFSRLIYHTMLSREQVQPLYLPFHYSCALWCFINLLHCACMWTPSLLFPKCCWLLLRFNPNGAYNTLCFLHCLTQTRSQYFTKSRNHCFAVWPAFPLIPFCVKLDSCVSVTVITARAGSNLSEIEVGSVVCFHSIWKSCWIGCCKCIPTGHQ